MLSTARGSFTKSKSRARAFGFAVVHAAREKWASAAIRELIARYPDLTFTGSAECDMSAEYCGLFVGRYIRRHLLKPGHLIST
jgi:hypothetical protein